MVRLHAFVYVTDMRRSVAFYRTLLGSPPVRESDHWTEFRVGASMLALHRWEGPSAPSSSGAKLLLEVESLDAARRRLDEAGAQVRGEVQEVPQAGRYLDFQDPDGHVLQLWEPPRT